MTSCMSYGLIGAAGCLCRPGGHDGSNSPAACPTAEHCSTGHCRTGFANRAVPNAAARHTAAAAAANDSAAEMECHVLRVAATLFRQAQSSSSHCTHRRHKRYSLESRARDCRYAYSSTWCLQSTRTWTCICKACLYMS